MGKPLAAIGVSIFRQPLAWIKACISSALNQTEQNIEVIVRIDGSDGADAQTSAWLACKSTEDRRLRVIHGDKNLGNFGSLKQIFNQSSSRYIVQLDADDMLHPLAIELSCKTLENDESLSFVYTNAQNIDERGNALGAQERQHIPYCHNRILVQFMTFHMRCIRRSSYEAIGGYRSGYFYCGDYDLSLRLSEAGAVGYLPKVLYFYRLHESSASARKRHETMLESNMASKSAFYRRGLAFTHYLLTSGNTLSLIEWHKKDPECTASRGIEIVFERYSEWLE